MNVQSPSTEDTVAVATHQLVRRFGRRAVIQGLDLKVPSGVVYGFLGRNGAGKTTTIKMLMGMLAPHQGRIEILGTPRRRVTASDRQRIGYVSQEQHFYAWMTVRQLERFISGFYPTWSTNAFDRLLETLSIDSTQTVGTLSGGTKMKLAMALALAHKPRLLILDEPTAGVDPIARREILGLLTAEARERGRTVFFSTHNIGEIEDIGDWVGILHEGRMLYQGRVAELSAWVRKMPDTPAGPFRVLLREPDGVVVLGRPDHFDATGMPSTSVSPRRRVLRHHAERAVIVRLAVKEAREHRWVAIGVVFLAVAQYLAFLQFSLRHEPPTALVAATNFVWGTGPMVAAYTARRLFVLEQEQRTIQLLRSLPISPAAVTVTKLALGLVYNLALSLSVLWNQRLGSAEPRDYQRGLAAAAVGAGGGLRLRVVRARVFSCASRRLSVRGVARVFCRARESRRCVRQSRAVRVLDGVAR